MADQQKSYMIYRMALFQWPWTTPNPSFKVMPSFDTENLRNDRRYKHSFNGILIGIAHALLNSVISSGLSKIFNDMKRRTVSATAELFVWQATGHAHEVCQGHSQQIDEVCVQLTPDQCDRKQWHKVKEMCCIRKFIRQQHIQQQKYGYGFLFTFHSNYGHIFSHFGDIQQSKNGRTLKSGFGVVQGHCKWRHSIDHVWLSISLPV